MLHLLKRYPCAFCPSRFDTKFSLRHHELGHLKLVPFNKAQNAQKIAGLGKGVSISLVSPKSPKTKSKKQPLTPSIINLDDEDDAVQVVNKTPKKSPKKKNSSKVVEILDSEDEVDGDDSKDFKIKKKKKAEEGEDDTPKVRRNTRMSGVQDHGNAAGPICFKCGIQCKDHSNLKNHILSHYYRAFDKYVPAVKPYVCPVCEKPSRDKITLIRHFAFTHQKLFELTDLTHRQLSLEYAKECSKNFPPGGVAKEEVPESNSGEASVNTSVEDATDADASVKKCTEEVKDDVASVNKSTEEVNAGDTDEIKVADPKPDNISNDSPKGNVITLDVEEDAEKQVIPEPDTNTSVTNNALSNVITLGAEEDTERDKKQSEATEADIRSKELNSDQDEFKVNETRIVNFDRVASKDSPEETTNEIVKSPDKVEAELPSETPMEVDN